MQSNVHFSWCAATFLTAAFSAGAFGQASYQVLSDPTGEFVSPSIQAVSFDGRVVVGRAITALGPQAFRWTQETGFTGLGYVDSSDIESHARAVSGDGSVVVGHVSGPLGTRAFRWTADGMQTLPCGTVECIAVGTSFDGKVVVGWASSNGTPPQAFRWVEGQGVQWLGFLSTDYHASQAHAVSADGNVVAGESRVGEYEVRAFRWTPETGMQDLHAGGSSSTAYAISADGTVVVGARWGSRCDASSEAFRWTQSTGMVGLGDIPGGECETTASATTAGGEMIVGPARTLQSGNVPAIWDSVHGLRTLRAAMEVDCGLELTGIGLAATAISLDGSTVAGGSWIVRRCDSIGPKLQQTVPPNGAIDARQDYSVTGLTPQGINTVRLSFSMPVVDASTLDALTAASFVVTDTNGTPPPIIEVLPVEGTFATYDVVLADRITPAAWTTLVAMASNTNGGAIQPEPFDRIDIGFLPGDVNGDGTASAVDILALIDSLNGVTPRHGISTDINRSNATNPADILRLIDLLNGVNTSRSWLGASLPPRP